MSVCSQGGGVELIVNKVDGCLGSSLLFSIFAATIP